MKKAVSPYNPANILSMARIILVPFFVVFLKEGRDILAWCLFVAACLTDFLDGFLARRFEWQTRLGQFIDPLGDKLLTLSAFVLLDFQGRVPFWVVVLAFAREIVVVTGYILLAVVARMTDLKVSRVGKLGTLMQMFSLGFYLADGWMGWSPAVKQGLLWAVEASVVLNFVGGLDYALRGTHDFEKSRKAKRPG
jgi:CDP-diacylglycerol--glycerol-3-phosphate 3-phosphatidyltransferase